MKLVVFRGDAVETEVRLTPGKTIKVGRDAQNDIVLDDPNKGVSRLHCEIRAERGRFVIADMKSRNGVYVGGKRIKNTSDLALGVPATVGPFELVLEDEAASALVDDEASGINPTVIASPSGHAASGPSQSRPGTTTARGATGASWLQSRQTQMWGAAALGVLLVGGVTFVVVQNLTGATPGEVTATVVVDPPMTPPPPPEPPIEDPKVKEIAELEVTIENSLGMKDSAAALEGVRRLRELDETHAKLSDFESRANALAVAATKPPEVKIPPTKPQVAPAAAIVLVVGIPARPNEDNAAYQARAQRIQRELEQGKASLAKDEFTTALMHFKNVQAEQSNYQDVGRLIGEAENRQREVVNNAIVSGQQNEGSNNLQGARGWYQAALRADPASSQASERLDAVVKKIREQAKGLLLTAGIYAKQQRARDAATKGYQQVLKLTEPSDPEHQEALNGLESLK